MMGLERGHLNAVKRKTKSEGKTEVVVVVVVVVVLLSCLGRETQSHYSLTSYNNNNKYNSN
jgi:hypothetical protein